MGKIQNSLIVLAGGFSSRFGQDKGQFKLKGKSLILHILDRISNLVDEVLVVVSSKVQAKEYRLLKPKMKIIMDTYKMRCPLVGALTGFENSKGEYTLLFPCDTPFVSNKIASLLLDLCIDKEAVIPQWPNGYLEPLQAAYHRKSALTAAKKAIEEKKLNMRTMIVLLKKVHYISTSVLKEYDPSLMTFFNINSYEDFREAENVLEEIKISKD